MGVADRGYMRGRGPPPIALGTSWTLRFVILVVVVSLFVDGARGWFGWGGRSSLYLTLDAFSGGRWWTIVTAAFVHAGAFELLFNALGLWFFGKLVEETLGSARFVAFVCLAVLVPHAVFLAEQFAAGQDAVAIGSAGIVTSMLVFAAFRFPGMPISFWGLPLVLWQLAAFYVGIDVYRLVTHSGGGDYWTHLGGAAFGWTVHKFGLVPNFRLPSRASPSRKAREPGPFAEGNARAEIDRLLDKIAKDGIGSLSEDEREFLKQNSGRYR